MGTDIHPTVQVSLDGERWGTVQRTLTLDGGWFGPSTQWGERWAIDARDYDVFAMLADVRNGAGFAGIDTGDGFVTLSDFLGRDLSGLPEGCGIFEDEIDHTPMSVTLRDLLDAKRKGYFDLVTRQRGLIPRSNLPADAVLLETADQDTPTAFGDPARPLYEIGVEPSSYCGGTTADGYVRVQWAVSYGKTAARLVRFIDELTDVIHTVSRQMVVETTPPGGRGYATVLLDPDDKPMPHWVDVADRARLVAWFDS